MELNKLISDIRMDINKRIDGVTISSLGENLYGKINFSLIVKNGKAEKLELYDYNRGIQQTFKLNN